MTHIWANGNHPDVGSAELERAIGHNSLCFASKDNGINRLLLGDKAVTGHFVITRMGAKHHKRIRLCGQLGERLIIVDVYPESFAGKSYMMNGIRVRKSYRTARQPLLPRNRRGG